MIHSYWYIADTPGPVLLGLPACEKLAVVQMNCAVKTTQPNRSPTGTTPTQAARAAKTPTTRTSKSKCIKSTDDLMREFPDRFTGIGKFPGEYKIWPVSRCSSSHTHTQKMSDCSTSQGQGAPGRNGSPGSNHPCRPAHRLGIINYLHTKGKWWALPMSRSIWPQQSNLPWAPQDAYCRRSHTWVCKFALLHQAWRMSWILVNSPWCRIKSFNYLQQPPWEVLFPASSFSLVCSQDIFQKKMDQFLADCPGCIGIANDITVHGCTEAEHDAHLHNLMQVACKYGVVFNPQKMHVNFFVCLYNANGVHPDPEKVDAVHALQHPRMSLNSKSSLAWWHTSAPSSMVCPPWLPLCENSWEKMLTSPGMPVMRPLLSKSSKPSSATPPSDTSTCHCLWPYKLMLHR